MAGGNNMTVEVVGVREMMKALRLIDPELRKETVKAVKTAAKPIQNTAKESYPSKVMRNWRSTPARNGRVRGGRGWPAYDQGTARSKVKIQYGGRAVKERTRWRLLRVVQADAAASIFDIAGRNKPTGNGSIQAQYFMSNLNLASNGRKASRTIWPAVEQHQPEVVESVVRALKVVERVVQRKADA